MTNRGRVISGTCSLMVLFAAGLCRCTGGDPPCLMPCTTQPPASQPEGTGPILPPVPPPPPPPPQPSPPVFTRFPADRNLGANPAAIPECTSDEVTATADCDGTPAVTCSSTDSTNGCVHTRTLTYKATDSCGHHVERTQRITWKVDTTAPGFARFPEDRDLGANPASIPDCNTSEVAATDDCGGTPVITCSSADSASGSAHTRTLTYKATDANGNYAVRDQHVTWTVEATTPANPWGENVTLITITKGRTITLAGNLADGAPVSDLSFASTGNVACFTSVQASMFYKGNHVFYALESPQPSHSILRITVTPDPGVEVSLYGYQIGTTRYYVPPNVPSAICESSQASTLSGPNPGVSESIELHAPANGYNVFFAVAGDAATGSSGAYTLTVELINAY